MSAKSGVPKQEFSKAFRRGRKVVLSLISIAVIFILIVQIIPTSYFRADPKGDSSGVKVAIILGFGYETASDGEMKPGAANEFLLRFVLKNYPQVRTTLVQEGIRTAACKTSVEDCEVDGVRLLRIHRHDPAVDVNTFETAVCAIKRMEEFGEKKAILVAHHLQLWRAGKCFERVKEELCKDCEFVMPDVPDTPYPANSVQCRTRNEFNYRFSEIYARLRDSSIFSPDVPRQCVAPETQGIK